MTRRKVWVGRPPRVRWRLKGGFASGAIARFWEGSDRERPSIDLSHKIKIARAFGFIPPALAAEIHKIRAIRNRFAHTDDHLTFKNDEIAKLVSKLEAAQGANSVDPRRSSPPQSSIADELIKLWKEGSRDRSVLPG
ncbi:DUF4145 domain-containing protein [Mesorhizobium sp. WSM4982]|uniref:DUF4145 domain-containing protein n=1 Tax=unclassified Mesorhizobium TaxID=325217 RepID=UPI0024152AAD|nr:DUF4145 domain-containing protein [Mesorhizobium sp. WSM4982]MDG4853730.1 hypothetical protein [Mesorhizobium sp. WSM4982]